MTVMNSRKFGLFDRWRGAFGRWARLAHWLNTVARALNRAHSLSPLSSLEIGPDGGLEHDFDEEALLKLAASSVPAAPFRISLPTSATYSVTAGTVWCRSAGSLEVAAVADVAIAASSWIYVPVTISVAGTVTAGAITAATSEPTYWGRDGSNQTVINLVVGKITVASGVAAIDWNTTGDRDLYAHAGQTVAVSHANNPVALADAFGDTGTYSSGTHALVYIGALVGAEPGQTLRLYVSVADIADIIETIIDGGSGDLYDTIVGIVAAIVASWSELAAAPAYVLGKDASGNVGWVEVGTCS